MKIIWLTSKIFSFRRRENSKEVILEIEKIGDEGECEKRGVQTMLSVSPVEDALTIKQRGISHPRPSRFCRDVKVFCVKKKFESNLRCGFFRENIPELRLFLISSSFLSVAYHFVFSSFSSAKSEINGKARNEKEKLYYYQAHNILFSQRK